MSELPLENPSLPVSSSSTSTSRQSFQLFPTLPSELRTQIWQAALAPHIIRWIRIDELPTAEHINVFSSSLRTSPLLTTSRESRDNVFLRAHFLDVSKRTWIDPSIDYLHLDPSWIHLNRPPSFASKDALSIIPNDLLRSVKKIMVNPNYTDSRMRPGLPLERFTRLERILVVADEKSLGAQDKFLLASVYDLQKYYEGIKRSQPESKMKIPYIAIGCLGWTGDEKRKLVHGKENSRELVKVFDLQAQMKDYLAEMREEEVDFLKKRFEGKSSGFKLKFREGKSVKIPEVGGVARVPGFEELDSGVPEEDELPKYAEVVAADATSMSESRDTQVATTV